MLSLNCVLRVRKEKIIEKLHVNQVLTNFLSYVPFRVNKQPVHFLVKFRSCPNLYAYLVCRGRGILWEFTCAEKVAFFFFRINISCCDRYCFFLPKFLLKSACNKCYNFQRAYVHIHNIVAPNAKSFELRETEGMVLRFCVLLADLLLSQ